MAVEVSRSSYFHCQHTLFPTRYSFSSKSIHLTFSTNSSNRLPALHYSDHGRRRRRTTRVSATSSFDGFVNGDYRELDLMNRDHAGASNSSNNDGDDDFSSSPIEILANSLDLPISLRILKRKRKRWETDVLLKNCYACCSINNVFSSMVFIVQEILNYAIQKNQGMVIFGKEQDEVHDYFIWLFQHIFSATPNLMVYLILLLANFTLFSITQYPAPSQLPAAMSVEESENPSIVNTFFNGGGDGVGKVQGIAGEEEGVEGEYETAWKGILEEVDRIRGKERHVALMDPVMLRRFVSPVSVEIETEDLTAYSLTELSYRRAVLENPDDPLILANFAQFLYLVRRDHQSAEEYFKRAAKAEPADGEALCRYANFLWAAKADTEAAEEKFLEAIAAEPANSYYSANYAHFLWSTGGEDTCYPLETGDA